MATVTGLITVNGKQILEVDADPAALTGTPAPLGSLAMYDSGSVGRLYVKIASADTGWQEVDMQEGVDWKIDGNTLTGSGPTAPNEFFGSLNDFDLAFQRNNVELMRLATAGLLVGLNASLGGRLQVGVGALGDDLIKQVSPNGGSGSQVIHVTRQYKAQTTDATPTTLADIATTSDSVTAINAKVVCRQHGGVAGTAGDGASYVRDIHARNIGGAVAVRQNASTITSEDVGAFNLTVGTSGANVRLQAVGAASRNIAWFAHVGLLIAVN